MSIKEFCVLKSLLNEHIIFESESFVVNEENRQAYLKKDCTDAASMKINRLVKSLDKYIDNHAMSLKSVLDGYNQDVKNLFIKFEKHKYFESSSFLLVALSIMSKMVENKENKFFTEEDVEFITRETFKYIAKYELEKDYSVFLNNEIKNLDFVSNSSKLGDLIYEECKNG